MSFVPTIRDFFLREVNYKSIKMPSGDISFILGIYSSFVFKGKSSQLINSIQCSLLVFWF